MKEAIIVTVVIVSLSYCTGLVVSGVFISKIEVVLIAGDFIGA